MIFGLIRFILAATGRLIGFLIGTVLMIAGLVLTVTVVGAVVGIPLLIAGFVMVVAALFR